MELLTEARIREVLGVIGLDYLADRPGVFTEEINWEEQLSLGEQQRLAIARLIWPLHGSVYHSPNGL